MFKDKKTFYIFVTTVLICFILISGCNQNPNATKISLVPEPSLGTGIYRVDGLDAGGGLIWSPDGKYLAGLIENLPLPDCPPLPIFCIFQDEPYSEIFLVKIENWERQTILRTEYGDRTISSISWFPDSNHIAYHSNTGKLGDWGTIRSIEINGQSDTTYLEEGGYAVWNPDGSKVAVTEIVGVPGDWHPEINIIDLTSKQKKRVFKADEPISFILSLSWTSDGKVLAFSYGKIGSDVEPDLKPNIFFLDVATNALDQVTNDEFEYWSANFSPKNNLIALQRYNAPGIIKNLISNCEVELPINNISSASWSPDGQKLVISSGRQAYLVDLIEFIGSNTGSICP